MSFGTAANRIASGTWDTLVGQLTNIGVFIWDFGLTVYNLTAGEKPVGKVVAQGCPGYAGVWPTYIAPTDKDSRSCCPALNALANHGIVNRDGRNIKYSELTSAVHKTFNFAPSFCFFVSNFYATKLSRDYNTDTINLSDFNVHNIIEHDASLIRHDVVVQPDQSKPALDLIDELLDSATGPNNTLTPEDMSRALSKRRRESKAKNSQFSLSFGQKLFASSNASTLLCHFGGEVKDISVFLKEERIPDGWESKIRSPGGLTIATFNKTTFQVELGIDESPLPSKKHD